MSLQELIDAARDYRMSPEECAAQLLSFAWGSAERTWRQYHLENKTAPIEVTHVD